MGKRIVLFTTVLGACAAGQMMGMQEKSVNTQQTIGFYLTNGLKIKACSADAKALFKKAAKLKGQEILETLPLDKSDKLKLKAAFAYARRSNQTVAETYTSDKITYLTLITPLMKDNKDKKHNFFVEVQPKGHIDQKAALQEPTEADSANSTAENDYQQPMRGSMATSAVFEALYELH